MKIGDLVTVKPANEGYYIITDTKVRGNSNLVMLASLTGNLLPYPMPMEKKWIEVINGAKPFTAGR